VPRAAAGYERELKELLQGEREALHAYARRLPPTERGALEDHRHRPFLVVRAAGSHGFDLVALRPEFSFPIEVKSSSGDTIHFSAASGRSTEQWKAHRVAAARVDLLVVYAYRRLGRVPGDCWRLFAAGGGSGDGRLRLLMGRLPPVEETREGHGVLRWEHGLPLTGFLERVAFLTQPVGSAGA
jgi:hypothetical protein